MYKILLCMRYLRTRYIALASIVSVMLGVATMIVVNSVMAGFSTEMRERIHGILADVVIETNSLDGKPDPQGEMNRARKAAGEYIEAMTATVEVYGLLSFQYAGQDITRPVTLIGIDPVGKAKVGPLRASLESFNPVMEGDVVVRDTLRGPDESPSWNLTKEAQEYRRDWMVREEAFRRHWQQQSQASNEFEGFDDPFNRQPELPPETVIQAGHPLPAADGSPEETGVKTPTTGTQNVETADVANVPAKAAQPDSQPVDPFAPSPDRPIFIDDEKLPVKTASAEDNYKPLPARLYVGSGLITFPYTDRDTGQRKLVKMVQEGDNVRVSTVTAGRPPESVHFNATVVDIFKSGMSEYDANLVFCNLEELQRVRGMIDPQSGTRSVTSIQIKLKDYADADAAVERLQAVFPAGVFSVRTWEQKQGPLLAAVEIESAILNVLLFLIITVAGFGILAIFFMIVVEKTRDIGILKSLGASSKGVMSIFVSYGLALGIVGSGVGVVLGLLFVHYINVIEGWITQITGRKVFDDRIYYFPEIPTAVNASMVLWVALGATTIAVLASILPARRAARLHPVEALRYE